MRWNVYQGDRRRATLDARTAEEAVAYAAALWCIPWKQLRAEKVEETSKK